MTFDRENGSSSVIRDDMALEGDVVCKSDMQVDGEIRGNVSCVNLFVSRGGQVTGDVNCDSVEVEGRINGIITATRVDLLAGCTVEGEIVSESLSIDHGATFSGSARPQKAKTAPDLKDAAE